MDLLELQDRGQSRVGSVSAFGCGYFSTAIERSEVWTGLLFLVGRETGPFLGDLALLICAFTTGGCPFNTGYGFALHCRRPVPLGYLDDQQPYWTARPEVHLGWDGIEQNNNTALSISCTFIPDTTLIHI